MIRAINVPNFLHDVLGEQTTALELSLIFGFGGVGSLLLFSLHPASWQNLPLWTVLLLFALTLDILAGCVANFSRATSNFYAVRPKNRLVFIALHVQPLILALLLDTDMLIATGVWLYTIITALIISALNQNRFQLIIAGFLLSLGLMGLVHLIAFPSLIGSILLLYFVKVAYSFAVNHYATS